MKVIPTKVHGVVDYLTAFMLFVLPRILGLPDTATLLMTIMAGTTLIYSVLTRYELGLLPMLSMKAHLILDGLSGALFLAAPLFLPDIGRTTTIVLIAIGLFELTVTLLTQTDTPVYEQSANR